MIEADENQQEEQTEKVFIVQETLDGTSADVIVCFCARGLEYGYGWFDEIHERGGDKLKNALKKYKHLSVGNARITPAFGMNNFKAICHVVVPEVFVFEENPLESALMRMYCKNAIDVAAEAQYKSIVFPSIINKTELSWQASEYMRCFREYANESPYYEILSEIKVVCTDDVIYNHFYNIASVTANKQPIEIKKAKDDDEEYNPPNDSSAVEDDLEQSQTKKSGGKKRKRGDDMVPIPASDIEHMKSNGMYLVLSAKLEPTILNLKDEAGLKRQYRMTNRSRDGRKLYFRCSRCDTLSKKNSDSVRARLIICNGEVVGDEFPVHHPDCQPWTDEQLLVQQIDRSSRKTVKEGLLQPFEAYQDALSRITSVANQAEARVIEVPRFPEWGPKRNQAMNRKKNKLEIGIGEEIPIEEHEVYEEVSYIEETEGQEQTQEYAIEEVPSEPAPDNHISVTD